MSTTTDLSTLKINYLTQAQYDEAKRQGIVNENELYLTPATGSGVTDVEVDGVSVVSGGVAEITMPTVPTKVSDLTNDSGFITGYTETDPTVPSWAKASSKPSYTASEVGAVPTSRTINGKALSSNITLSASDVSALPSSTVIPTITDTYSGTSSNGMSGKAVKSAIDALDGTVTGTAGSSKTLTAFSQTDGKVSATFGSISITKSQVSDFPTIPSTAADVGAVPTSRKVNGKALSSDITLSASDVSALPSSTSIPSKTSDLTNDSGFITGYTETDPVFAASAAHGITSSDISTWNGKSTVSLTRRTTSGTNIADLTINGTTTKLYAPTGGGGTLTDVTVDGVSVVSGSTAEIDLTGKADVSDIPTKVSDLTNDSGYITGYTETDPVFSASAAHGITSSDISNWNGKSDFSGSYNDLTDKPTIPTVNNATLTIQKNGTTVKTFTANASSNVTANITVPTKTSDITNDSGFITGFTETDPTVPSWAKASSKPTYTASEVGAVPTTRTVNGKALSSDITLTASDVSALPSSTAIPTKTSDLTNDSGFISDTNLADYVVEQGTSGLWGYRKWNSGVAECWGRVEKSNIAYTTQRFGINGYMGEVTGTFPISLGTNPRVIANGTAFANTYGMFMQSFSSDGVNFTVRLLREGSATTGVTIVNIYAIGVWK